jgi:hypothetical protein
MGSRPTTPIGPRDPLIDYRSGKPKRISKPLAAAIRFLEDGTCASIRAAAERAGLNVSYLYEALKKPHVTRVLGERKRQNLAAAALRGSQRALELVDSPSERTSIEATKLVLAIDGYRPETSPLVNINLQGDVKAGYVIDLGDVDRSSPDILEGEVMRDERLEAEPVVQQFEPTRRDDASDRER